MKIKVYKNGDVIVTLSFPEGDMKVNGMDTDDMSKAKRINQKDSEAQSW